MTNYHRQLVIVNKDNKFIVLTRLENATGSAARITKELYATLTDGKHIAYYAHVPSKVRVPALIHGRYYVKPAGWQPKA
jgi:plasmid stabilization system protein ParE